MYLPNFTYMVTLYHITLYNTIPTYFTLNEKALENIVGKGENAGDQHFLLLPQYFPPLPKKIQLFDSLLFFRLQMLSFWSSLKFCHLVES